MKTRAALIALLSLALVVSGAGWVWWNYRGAAGEMTRSAELFLAALTPEQRAQAQLPYESPKRVGWHFIPLAERKGLQVKNMTPDQRKLAMTLLDSCLSEVGYTKATTIMSLESILAELEKKRVGGNIRDPERYYFTIFGQPTPEGQWGLSIEGHHLSLNFAVAANEVSSHTPSFFGANPAIVPEGLTVGPKAGTRILRDEEAFGFELFNSLDPAQQKVALIAEKAPADIRAAGEKHPPQTAPEGLAAEKLTPEQVKVLWNLLKAYANNMPTELASARLEEIEQAGINKVYFAWAGANKPGIGHYYRVQGPTFLLEFANVQPDVAGNPANHIHSVWRNMQGDFALRVDTPHETK